MKLLHCYHKEFHVGEGGGLTSESVPVPKIPIRSPVYYTENPLEAQLRWLHTVCKNVENG